MTVFVFSLRTLWPAELINKLNFLEDEDQETVPTASTNPFEESEDHDHNIHANNLNPFDDPDEEGMLVSHLCQRLLESVISVSTSRTVLCSSIRAPCSSGAQAA